MLHRNGCSVVYLPLLISWEWAVSIFKRLHTVAANATTNEFPTKLNKYEHNEWKEKKAQTSMNGWCKRNSEKVKIHIFHLSGAAHTSIKCVIILVNLWRYSIVVVWHFFRSNKIIANTDTLPTANKTNSKHIWSTAKWRWNYMEDWNIEIFEYFTLNKSSKERKTIHKINGSIGINVFHFDGF